jgi:predicted permease
MPDFLKILLEVISITFPIFAVIAIGFLIKRKGIIKDEHVPMLNKLTYDFGLSTLVFIEITKYKLGEIFDIGIIKVIYSTFFITLVIVFLSFFSLKINNKTRGAVIVSAYRSNMAFIGIPILLYAYGSLAAAKASVVIAFLYPFNIISTFLIFKFMDFREQQNTQKISFRRLILEIITDPVIIAVILGLIISYFNFKIPDPVSKIFEILAGIAVPLALISIGSSFKFSHIKNNIKYLSIISFLKLIIMPLIALMLSIFIFGVEKLDRDVICILFGMPLAVATFIQSEKYFSDSDFISSALITTTIASAFTISAWLFILKLI